MVVLDDAAPAAREHALLTTIEGDAASVMDTRRAAEAADAAGQLIGG